VIKDIWLETSKHRKKEPAV